MTYTVTMKWNEATETWRMLLSGFTIQENHGDIVPNPKDFFNCISINMMFKGLDKLVPKRYKVTIEEE